jgi:hypothetical protein
MNTGIPKLITLSCPSCGAKLEITPTVNRFACAYCGQEHIVNRTGGTISLSPVVEAIHKVQTGVDKTAAELAIVRLQKEISELRVEKQKVQLEKQNMQLEKQNILRKYPEPQVDGTSISSLILGFGLVILALCTIAGLGWMISLAILVSGFFFILLGLLPIFRLPLKKLDWEDIVTSRKNNIDVSIKNLDARINYIDTQIAEEQTRLEQNQNLVKY